MTMLNRIKNDRMVTKKIHRNVTKNKTRYEIEKQNKALKIVRLH